MKKIFLLPLVMFAVLIAQSQDTLPNTDIFLVSIQSHGNHWHIGQPKKITNNPGYDNQPYFLSGGNKLLYSTMRDGKQTDIFVNIFDSNSIGQITNTKESEYSPVMLPGEPSISVVRVEADGKTQRLWKININTKEEKILLPEVKNVGYYAWLNENDVALFLLGETHDLYLGDTKTGKVQELDKNIGRSLHKVPGENAFLYVSKKDTANWAIMKYNLDSKKSSQIAHTLKGSEDFAVLPDGSLLMGQRGKLFHLTPGFMAEWQPIHDFSGTAAADFYRIAVSADGSKIALVANVKE